MSPEAILFPWLEVKHGPEMRSRSLGTYSVLREERKSTSERIHVGSHLLSHGLGDVGYSSQQRVRRDLIGKVASKERSVGGDRVNCMSLRDGVCLRG